MNAHALLTSQGWRGHGHSLHATSDNTGLTRPLLVSQKQNNFGVGKNQHKTSDMWWLNAFDSTLKGLDTSTEGKVVQTLTSGGLDMIKKGGARFAGNGGLYSVFVKGEGLEGTISRKLGGQPGDIVKQEMKEKSSETKEQRRARKAARRAARAAAETEEMSTSTPTETVDEEIEEVTETKEQRRERRQLKRLQRQADQEAEVNAESKTSTKKKKRRKD